LACAGNHLIFFFGHDSLLLSLSLELIAPMQ